MATRPQQPSALPGHHHLLHPAVPADCASRCGAGHLPRRHPPRTGGPSCAMRACWPAAGNAGDHPPPRPRTASLSAFTGVGQAGGTPGSCLSEAGRVWGGRRGAFSFQNNPLPQYLSRRAFHFQTWDEITSSIGVEWNEHWIRSVETQRPTPGAPCDLGEVYGVNLLSFIHSFIHCLAQKPVLGTCYCPSTELSLGIPWGL